MTEDNLFGLSKETIARHRDVEERRRYWEEQEAARLEQEAEAELRAELAADLTRRGEDYKRITGASEVPRSVLEGWQAEFVNGKEKEQQAEQQRRHEAVVANDDVF